MRTDTTRQALVAAARRLFVEKGYGATSTPEIVKSACVTRGALYHHFADKRDLFRAVVTAESRAVAVEIETAEVAGLSPRETLLAGSATYLDAMSVPGRTRLLLVDGPAVLSHEEMSALNDQDSGQALEAGLKAALPQPRRAGLPIPQLAALLSSAFDRAALGIEFESDPNAYRGAMKALIECVVRD